MSEIYGAFGAFEFPDEPVDWDEHDAQMAQEIAEHEAEMAFWDDDPNPYHGDYSEM